MKVLIHGQDGKRLTPSNEYVGGLVCLEIDRVNQSNQQSILVASKGIKDLISALEAISK